MSANDLMEHGSERMRFIMLTNIVTYDTSGEFGAHMLGFQEGMFFMREHPIEAGLILEEMFEDQRKTPGYDKMIDHLKESIEYFRKGHV